MTDYEMFTGKIEVIIEASSEKDAEEQLCEITEQIIKGNKYVYRTRYEMVKKEKTTKLLRTINIGNTVIDVWQDCDGKIILGGFGWIEYYDYTDEEKYECNKGPFESFFERYRACGCGRLYLRDEPYCPYCMARNPQYKETDK